MPNIQQRIACKALIEHKGEVLIMREAPTYQEGTNVGRFHLPGGRIKPGEPFLQGLTREVLEETGLAVSVVGQPLFVGEWFPVIKGAPNHIVAIFFVCTVTGRKVSLSAEHDHYEWIKPEAHASYDLMEPDPAVIQAYLQRAR